MSTESPVAEDTKPEIKILKTLVEKTTGSVKWFNHKRRYGFIKRNDVDEDVFVHRSAITAFSAKVPSLRYGEEVEFSVVETNQGIEATNVTGPEGKNVRGIPFRYYRSRRYYRGNGAKPNGDVENGVPEDKKEDSPENQIKPRRQKRNKKKRQNAGDVNGNQSDNEIYENPGNQASPTNKPNTNVRFANGDNNGEERGYIPTRRPGPRMRGMGRGMRRPFYRGGGGAMGAGGMGRGGNGGGQRIMRSRGGRRGGGSYYRRGGRGGGENGNPQQQQQVYDN